MDNSANSPPHPTATPKTSLSDTISLHFNQLFNRHPTLSPDQAFFLAATQLHHECLTKFQ